MGNLKLTSANEGISKQDLSVRKSPEIHQSRQMVLLFGASISTCRRSEEKTGLTIERRRSKNRLVFPTAFARQSSPETSHPICSYSLRLDLFTQLCDFIPCYSLLQIVSGLEIN